MVKFKCVRLCEFEMSLEDKIPSFWTETWAHSVPEWGCYTATHGGGVIFLEGCHHDGLLIDSSTATPCLTPEALNPNCATQVTNKGPEDECIFNFQRWPDSSCSLVSLFPLPLYKTEMWLMASASLQSTTYVHIMSCDNNYRYTSDKQDVYGISHTKDTKEAFHGISWWKANEATSTCWRSPMWVIMPYP